MLSLVGSETPYYIKLSDRITNEHIREMQKEGFSVTSSGGAMMNDVEKIGLVRVFAHSCQAQSEIDPFAQFKIDPPVNFFLSFSTFNLACFSF